MLKLIVAKDYAELSRRAAAQIALRVCARPNCVLGLATGSSPLGVYERLVEDYRQGELDFSRVRAVNLDEYEGLSAQHPQSYAYFMREHLFKHINIDLSNTFIPNGVAENPEEECRCYDALIESLGGVDIQLLGIGHNGHIGFNEPDSAFVVGTHRVALTQETIDANARFFAPDEEQPSSALTMGIGTIMSAKSILLIASGEAKAQIVKEAFFSPVTPQVPASVLQLHPDVTLIVDEAAGKLL